MKSRLYGLGFCAFSLAFWFSLGSTVHGQTKPEPGAATAKWNVAIVVHKGVELLDFAGPGEVFEAAARRGMQNNLPWFHVYTVAPTQEPVVSQGFLKIEPNYSIANAPRPDILVIPGGSTQYLVRDPAFMNWVRTCLNDSDIVFTVCTGAFVLAELNALAGKRATTHHGSLDALREQAAGATVLADVRFVDNGQLVTAAGVSAGIDGALHVVARLLGYEQARSTAHYMQYEWQPRPEDVESYAQWNPQLDPVGQAMEAATSLREAGKIDEALQAFRQIAAQHPQHGPAWYQIGHILHQRGELEPALSAHLKAAEFGVGNTKANGLYNAACVKALQGAPEQALDYLAQSAAAGWRNAQWALQDSDLKSLADAPRFQQILATAWVNDAREWLHRGDQNNALERLEKAAACGYDGFAQLADDDHFQIVRDSPRFQALLTTGGGK